MIKDLGNKSGLVFLMISFEKTMRADGKVAFEAEQTHLFGGMMRTRRILGRRRRRRCQRKEGS